jgi:hypothetical protein
MKFIQQGLYFPWFLKRTTTSSKNIIKNKIGIAIKFCKCYVIKRSPSNFSNKTQLKNIKNIYILILIVLNLNIVDLITTIAS